MGLFVAVIYFFLAPPPHWGGLSRGIGPKIYIKGSRVRSVERGGAGGKPAGLGCRGTFLRGCHMFFTAKLLRWYTGTYYLRATRPISNAECRIGGTKAQPLDVASLFSVSGSFYLLILSGMVAAAHFSTSPRPSRPGAHSKGTPGQIGSLVSPRGGPPLPRSPSLHVCLTRSSPCGS
jgi:hypothetical protein